jgi:hypothetical protein
MVQDPSTKTLLPSMLAQNPSPVDGGGQEALHTRTSLVARIMEAFTGMLPSNYVSSVTGPLYTIQLQAVAEVIADFQITAQEAFGDRMPDMTRGEFLFQLLGTLVFPDAQTEGLPSLDGDLTYRTFLQRMTALLLQGATLSSQQEGIGLLTDAEVQVLEKVIATRPVPRRVWDANLDQWVTENGSFWGLESQFSFEVNVSYTDSATGTQRFPEDPFVLSRNVHLVLRALKPAHSLYEYRHLFTEMLGGFQENLSWNLTQYYYEDMRVFWHGVSRIQGTNGSTHSSRHLFYDINRDFGSVRPGANLHIEAGVNKGTYRVLATQALSYGTDPTPRPYTTSPTGLTGVATVTDDTLEDSTQDWSQAVEGEVLTFMTGPNTAPVRLKTALGEHGGPLGHPLTTGPSTRVRAALSVLVLSVRLPTATGGQSYHVLVDHRGQKTPITVLAEDQSLVFTR